MRSDFKV